MTPRLAAVVLLAAGLAACAHNDIMVLGNESGDPRFLDTNFLTLEHAYTDEALAGARARAERECGRQKRLAVQTQRACSLSRCTTHYQCVTAKDAKEYGL